MLEWFNTTNVKKFGSELGDYYVNRAKQIDKSDKPKIIERKRRELLQKMEVQINLFSSSCELNIYKKAQLGNSFKWRLLDSGLEKPHVEEITSWLTKRL